MRIRKGNSLISVVIFGLVASCSPAFIAGQGQAGEGEPPKPNLDVAVIEAASGAKATVTDDGMVRIGWLRTDVEVDIDNRPFPPPAGLGSWAAFMQMPGGAVVMGDTVVFQDEVDAAMDAAFAAGLEITALHNHFFFDVPKVYFMHIGGHGDPEALAAGVKSVWDAIKGVRAARPVPALHFGGPTAEPGALDPTKIEEILGKKPSVNGGVVKVSFGRAAEMHGMTFGSSMGLTTWAAFSGSDALAVIDGDFAMTANEVQPVLRALRREGIHVVALHNHMVGESPAYYFTHYWATGPAAELARSFRDVLAVQGAVGDVSPATGNSRVWNFDSVALGSLPEGWKVEATNPRGELARWQVRADSSSPSRPSVLALVDSRDSEGSTYNLCWTDSVSMSDVTLEVKVKSGPGLEDQGGGPIWRAIDANNYYIARWNPLEDNFRAYYVKDGRRTQIATASVSSSPDEWHTIRIVHRGSKIQAYLDGRLLLEVEDSIFPDAGGVGLWTKADAETSFDDLVILD